MRPTLTLDGQLLTQGSRSVSIGQGHFLVVDFLFPGVGLVDRVFHAVFAGGYYAVGLDTIGHAGSILLDARGEHYKKAVGTTNDPSYSDAEIGDRLSLAALEYLDNVEQQIVKLGALLHNVQVEDVAEALTGQDIRIEFINGVLRFRPIGWFVDAKRVIARDFAVDGDESDREKKFQIMGLSGSYLENRLWEDYAGLPSISTAIGLQFANAVGIPILTIDQSNIATLLPTLNVFPHVRQAVVDAVTAGRVVTIPRDTLLFDDWVGSVWIDDLPGGLATGYLIAGGILGGASNQDPKTKQGENPLCTDVSAALDSDELKATAWQENQWGQFEPDKRPTDRKGDIGTMQVNQPTWVKQDAQGNPLPTIDIDGDGRKDPVDLDRLQYNWQYNIDVGTAIYANEFGPKAEAHLDSLVGAGNYTAAQLVTENYFLYNHGGNAKTKNGTRVKVFYYTKDANGKLMRASYPDLTEKDQKNIVQK